MRHFGEELRINLRYVICFRDTGDERWRNLFHVELLPVNIGEPRVVLDFCNASGSAADSFTRDLDEELRAEVGCLFAEVIRHFDLLLKYLVHLVDKGKFLASLEWVDSRQHLIEDETETIPID